MSARILSFGLWLAWSLFPAHAAITFSLTLRQEVKPAYHPSYGQTWYYALPTLSDTTNPISYHRVESPNDICNANFGTNTSSDILVFNAAADFFMQLTNGHWKLWLNRDTPEEQFYTFTITAAALASNLLGQITITTPGDGTVNTTNQPGYFWTGPAGFNAVEVSANNSPADWLGGMATNWSAGPVLNPGTNFFRVAYHKDATADFAVSIPTNATAGLLDGWGVGSIGLDSRATAGFIVAGLPPSALAQALDAPGLIWQTSGEADWFSQTAVTRDGRSAARSGAIGDSGFTTLRTLIYGTNTITFWWKSDSEASADYVEFTDNGAYVNDLTGASGWQKFTYPLAPGVAHWLEWTYYKDSAEAAGVDAVFLDQVRLTGDSGFPEGEPLTFALTISRQQSDAFEQLGPNQTWFRAFPSLSGPTNPLSYHRVESPNNFCHAQFGTTNLESSSDLKLSFAELVTELTNGNWKVWLNKETPQEQFTAFTLTALSFNANDLGTITITSPLNGATNISPAPQYEWSGLPAWDELFIAANQRRSATNHQYAEEFPILSATTWTGGPNLAPGTNDFWVRYRRNATTNFAIAKPFLNWLVGAVTLESSARSGFIVPAAAPVPLLNAQLIGSDFQFQFLTEPGRTYTIQSRPELDSGSWENRTNLVGNGLLQTVVLPISDIPAEFFRIETQ